MKRSHPLTLAVGGGMVVLGAAPFLGFNLPTIGFALLIASAALFSGLKPQSAGSALLALWLLALGATTLLSFEVPGLVTLLPLLAIIGGVLILLDR
ncbi:MAG TPA: hypothetical protein VGE07_09365 [Herpetosiphonaceae bacterium]